MSEFEIHYYGRRPNNEALIGHLGSIDNLDALTDSGTDSILELSGVSLDTFKHLLTCNFPVTDGPNPKKIRNEDGKKIEAIVSRIFETPEGRAEVSDCSLYPGVLDKQGRARVMIHMPGKEKRGFEAIYVIEGNARLFIPAGVREEDGDYYVSNKGKNFELSEGDIAIIPAPTPYGWNAVGKRFKFRYVAMPPYEEKDVRTSSYKL